MPGADEFATTTGGEGFALDDEGSRPKGGKLGSRVTQGSKVNPGAFPNAGGANRKADIIVYRGLRPKVTSTVAYSRVNGILERMAANKVRAKAVDAMSGDVVGQTVKVSKIGKPDRWVAIGQ